MSKYTTTFLEIARVLKGDFVEYAEAVELVKTYIFKRVMPFYNNNAEDKSIFQNQFLGYYINHEIGFETPDMFIGRLYNRLAVIMPKYEQLYKTLSFDFEQALLTFSETEQGGLSETGTNGFTNTLTHGLKTDTTSSDTGSATRTDDLTALRTDNLKTHLNASGNLTIHNLNNQQTLNSDEPNTTIANNAYASGLQKIEADNNQTNIETHNDTTDNTGTVTNTNTGTVSNSSTANGSVNTVNSGNDTTRNDGEHEFSRNHKVTRCGYQGNRNELVANFRDNILNLNEMIINECYDLFMQCF